MNLSYKLIKSNNTDEILHQLIFEKKLPESYIDLNSELEKGTVGTSETLRTLEGNYKILKRQA